MNLQQRKELLVQLGQYLQSNDEAWQLAKERAFRDNNWFMPEFIDAAVGEIVRQMLHKEAIDLLIERYNIPGEMKEPKKVGIVMAGNIPLVGFHDLLCTFLSGHIAIAKPSSKDEVLIKHIVAKLEEWEPSIAKWIILSPMLKNCDAYIATGSNNSSRYFEYYFKNYPSIIRKNRTSVAMLNGSETAEELEALADDVHLYFGLGCRNVSKIYVPKDYDFIPLLEAFRKYNYLANHHKYKNNYDYNLAVHILNNDYYMSNESIILAEKASPFSPISQLHYEYYGNAAELRLKLLGDDNIQCVVGKDNIPFGKAQCPGVTDFADGVDTMVFLMNLSKKS